MNARGLWLAALLPLAAGCGKGDDAKTAGTVEEMGKGTDTMQITGAVADTASQAADTAAGTADQMLANQVPLAALGNSRVTGTAVLGSGAGGGTTIQLNLVNGMALHAHAAAVHEGSCEQIGRVVAPLDPVTVGPRGTGYSNTVVPIPAATLRNGRHVVVAAAGTPSEGTPVESAPPVACGNLGTQATGSTATSTAPVSPGQGVGAGAGSTSGTGGGGSGQPGQVP